MDELYWVLTRRDFILVQGCLLTALYAAFASELLINFFSKVDSGCHLGQSGDILLAEVAYPGVPELLNGVIWNAICVELEGSYFGLKNKNSVASFGFNLAKGFVTQYDEVLNNIHFHITI